MAIHTSKIYNFVTDPRGTVHVLLNVDEATYLGKTMGANHPIAWCQLYDGGRVWYTAGGYTAASYAEALFQAHILGGIEYAMGTANANCR